MATDDLGADRRSDDLDSAFRAHRDWLVQRLALIVGDAEEARDLAQEAFVRAAEQWPLPDMREPARWLSTVGVRLAIDVDGTLASVDAPLVATDSNGDFELTIRSPKGRYEAGEPIDVEATLAYTGRGQTGDFDGGILFTGTQVDGTHSFAPGPTVDMCVPRPLSDLPHERELADWPKVRSLPAGTWRISATFSGSAPACTPGGSSLRASIDVTITAADEAARAIPLLTATDVDDVSSDRFCRLDTPHGSVGELVLDPTSGLGLASESGDIQPIRWPPGFSAEALPDGAILYGETGQIVAREGDLISFPAGLASDGVLSVCGQFLFW